MGMFCEEGEVARSEDSQMAVDEMKESDAVQ